VPHRLTGGRIHGVYSGRPAHVLDAPMAEATRGTVWVRIHGGPSTSTVGYKKGGPSNLTPIVQASSVLGPRLLGGPGRLIGTAVHMTMYDIVENRGFL
jgi:hypothetical protein